MRVTCASRSDGARVGKLARPVDGKVKVETKGKRHPDRFEVLELPTPRALAEFIDSGCGGGYLLAGVPKNGIASGGVVVKARRAPGEVALSDDDFEFPEGPGLLTLDFDPKTAAEGWRPDLDTDIQDYADVIEEVAPGLMAAWVRAPSSSSCISGEGVEPKGIKGHHHYVFIADGRDAPRSFEVLLKRLVIRGKGYGFVTRAGTVLIRTIIDTALSRPAQPIFAGGVRCAGGLTQTRRALIQNTTSADPADTRAVLPDLTPEEEKQYNAECRRLKDAAAPLAAAMRADWEARRVDARAAALAERNGLPADEARSRARSEESAGAPSSRLSGDELIETEKGCVTVSEIRAEPARWHRVACADPIEPEYGSGIGTAMLFTDGTPTIYSHAHGGRTYFLKATAAEEFGDYEDDTGVAPDSAEASSAAPSAREVALEPSKTQGRGLRVYALRDLLALPRPQWLIKGLLPRGGLAMLYGESGSGKTFATLDMVASIVRGQPWRDLRTELAGVVYVAAEAQQGIANRFRAYEKHHDISLDGAPLGIVAQGLDLIGDADAQRVIDACAQMKSAAHPIGLIVFDTLNRVMGGADENTSDAMGALIAEVDGIRAATGATVLVVHHSGKDQSRGARGHSSLRAAVDVEFEVTRKASGERFIRVTKSRDGEDGGQFPFRLKKVVLELDDDLDEISSCVAVPDRVVAVPSRPVATVKAQGVWQTAILAAAAEQDGLEGMHRDSLLERARAIRGVEPQSRWRDSAVRALQDLVNKGMAKQKGSMYDFSPLG